MARLGEERLEWTELEGARFGERIRELVTKINNALFRVRTVVNGNEGSAIHWDAVSLPTAGLEFAGKLLYHDLGQGVTPDNLYVCLWDGAAWNWVLIA